MTAPAAAKLTTAELRANPPRTFPEVFAAELSLVDERRKAGGFDPPRFPLDSANAFNHGLVGLALSGGGIRSASVNLGLLQALGKRGVLQRVDYLSTVSGGGYIGSCLSSLLSSSWANVEPGPSFPFWFDGKEENPVIKYLRQNRQYLGIEGGLLHLKTWRALSAFLGGLFVTMTTIVSFLVVGAGLYLGLLPWMVYYGERLAGLGHARAIGDATDLLKHPSEHLLVLLLPAFALLALWALSGGLYAAANIWPSLWRLKLRDWLSWVQSGLLAGAFVLALAGVLPLALSGLDDVSGRLKPYLTLSALLSSLSLPAVLRFSQNLKAAETALRAAQRWLVAIAASVLVVLICLAVLFGVWVHRGNAGMVALYAFVAVVLLSFLTDINRISMFYFYRDRLSEAFVIRRDPSGPQPVGRDGAVTGPPPLGKVVWNDPVTMAELAFPEERKRFPYHLVNACVNLPGSQDARLKDRRSDFFLLSPLYCGSPVLGYRDTLVYENNRVTVASGLAISGAAANPQFGTASKPALAFVLTMLNARLGVWAQNPRYAPPRHVPEFAHHWDWPLYLLREMLSIANEDDKLVNLSDGGHIENLGLYELLRRRCRTIIVSDAGADPQTHFDDLGNALRKARIDFGVEVKLDIGPIKEKKAHCVIGEIHYPVSSTEQHEKGTLLYVKSVLIPTDPIDLHQYQQEQPAFPHEPTTDQFFDEPQFESYRQLGYETGKSVCKAAEAAGLTDLGYGGKPRVFEVGARISR